MQGAEAPNVIDANEIARLYLSQKLSKCSPLVSRESFDSVMNTNLSDERKRFAEIVIFPNCVITRCIGEAYPLVNYEPNGRKGVLWEL